MRFLNPSLLSWASLLVAPVILYLFRRKPKIERVSQLVFFKTLDRAHQESAWLRRLKRLLSFLLSVLIMCAAVGALARMILGGSEQTLKNVVVLVDRSASMMAKDKLGRTRLSLAVKRVRKKLGTLHGAAAVSVMTYDRRPEILLPRTYDRREVVRALEAIRVRPIEGDPEKALVLASRMAALETPASVWHVTDSPPAAADAQAAHDTGNDQEKKAGKVMVEHLTVAPAGTVNVGITAFQIRRLPMELSRLEAFVQVHCAADEPTEAALEISIDGELTSVRKMTLDPGARKRLFVPLKAGQGKCLSLKLVAKDDVLALDDEVHGRIPEAQPIRVVWISPKPDPFTELALGSLAAEGVVEVFKGSTVSWPTETPADVVIFDGWLPKTWPEDVSVIVIDPPETDVPFRTVRIAESGVPVERIRVTEPGHPLLYGVAGGRIAVTQTGVLQADGPLEPLWVGPSGPVLAAGEISGQRLTVFAFDPERCEHLPLMASYPLLVGNAVYWSAQPRLRVQSGNNRRTGDLVRLEGKTITWTRPGDIHKGKNSAAIQGQWTELDRIGIWATDAGETGAASLLSRTETGLVRVHPEQKGSALEGDVASFFSGDMTGPFMWLVLLVLVVESYLFHRRAVY